MMPIDVLVLIILSVSTVMLLVSIWAVTTIGKRNVELAGKLKDAEINKDRSLRLAVAFVQSYLSVVIYPEKESMRKLSRILLKGLEGTYKNGDDEF